MYQVTVSEEQFYFDTKEEAKALYDIARQVYDRNEFMCFMEELKPSNKVRTQFTAYVEIDQTETMLKKTINWEEYLYETEFEVLKDNEKGWVQKFVDGTTDCDWVNSSETQASSVYITVMANSKKEAIKLLKGIEKEVKAGLRERNKVFEESEIERFMATANTVKVVPASVPGCTCGCVCHK
jgi:hypothetical protein